MNGRPVRAIGQEANKDECKECLAKAAELMADRAESTEHLEAGLRAAFEAMGRIATRRFQERKSRLYAS